MPLAEYQRRRQALEERGSSLERQRRQLEALLDQQQAATPVLVSIEGFCQRVPHSWAQATCDHRRQLVELLIDRVVVTDGDVEIHYVIPTTPASEHVQFSHWRTNYLSLLPPLAQ
jgi:site-specific DNA recombinase